MPAALGSVVDGVVFLSATLVGVLPLRCWQCRLVCLFFRWHPRYAFVLHASPLCGAAPTFLCRRKEK